MKTLLSGYQNFGRIMFSNTCIYVTAWHFLQCSLIIGHLQLNRKTAQMIFSFDVLSIMYNVFQIFIDFTNY